MERCLVKHSDFTYITSKVINLNKKHTSCDALFQKIDYISELPVLVLMGRYEPK
jgi:hypothetical protein